MKLARLRIPAEIVFGSGCAETIGQHVRSLGGTRALLISDRGLQKAGLVAQMERWLDKPL